MFREETELIRRSLNIIGTVLVIIIVLFTVLLVGVRLFGIQVFSVLSGSMEPTYHTGDLIYVKTIDPERVEVGDVITFVLPSEQTATHRVVRIDAQNQSFYTKGDANEAEDAAPVHCKNLIGTPVFSIPLLGYAASYVQSPPGMYVAMAVAAGLLILVFLPDIIGKRGNDEENEKGRARGAHEKE